MLYHLAQWLQADYSFLRLFNYLTVRAVLGILTALIFSFVFGPLLIGGSLTMTSYLVSVSLGFARGVPIAGELLLGLAPDFLLDLLPLHAEGWIGELVVEGFSGVPVLGERVALDDVASCLPRDEHVGLADGVGFGVDLLSVKMRGDLLAVRGGKAVPYKNLPAEEYTSVLRGAGVPELWAVGLPQFDLGAAQGALFDDGHQLSALIGRPTTAPAAYVAAALK